MDYELINEIADNDEREIEALRRSYEAEAAAEDEYEACKTPLWAADWYDE